MNQQKEFKQGVSYDCKRCLHFYLLTVVNGKQNWSLIYSFFFFPGSEERKDYLCFLLITVKMLFTNKI